MPVTKMNNHEKAKALVTTLAVQSVREQIQEDVLSYFDSDLNFANQNDLADDICQIVVDNFKKLEKWKN